MKRKTCADQTLKSIFQQVNTYHWEWIIIIASITEDIQSDL